MPADPNIPDAAAEFLGSADPPDPTRMSFGDHLEELRTCLIRALVGVLLAAMVGFLLGDRILDILFRPLFTAQAAQGLQPNLQALAPMSAVTAYLRIAMLSGLILSMPWILYQGWSFVSVGLYPKERLFARRLAGPSVILFALGVAFLYYIFLPVALNFFIDFNRRFNVPELGFPAVTAVEEPAAPHQDKLAPVTIGPRISIVKGELPTDAEVGTVLFHEPSGRLLIKTNTEWRSVASEPGSRGSVIQSQFALDAYISFVLTLALAFGLAFETPVVVFFLVWSGLVTLSALRQSRRYVLLGVVLIAAVLTPTPDVISQLFLAGPMYLLFELGLLAAKLKSPS